MKVIEELFVLLIRCASDLRELLHRRRKPFFIILLIISWAKICFPWRVMIHVSLMTNQYTKLGAKFKPVHREETPSKQLYAKWFGNLRPTSLKVKFLHLVLTQVCFVVRWVSRNAEEDNSIKSTWIEIYDDPDHTECRVLIDAVDAGTSSWRWHLLTTHIKYWSAQRAVAVTLPKFSVDTTVEDKLKKKKWLWPSETSEHRPQIILLDAVVVQK